MTRTFVSSSSSFEDQIGRSSAVASSVSAPFGPDLTTSNNAPPVLPRGFAQTAGLAEAKES